jgi:G3E family GTPase
MNRQITFRQITFTVIGGFLGAGKTSLVNRVLASAGDIRFAVLVNDFGALNIDQELIESQDSQIMQLSNGCICCSLAGGLVDAMVLLMAYRDKIDHILIEASGVSYPGRIMDFARIDPDLRAGLTLVLIDASSMPAQIRDSRLAEVISAQMRDADMFLLTKTDIAHEDDIARTRDYLASHQADAPVLTARADNANIIDMLLSDSNVPALDRPSAIDQQPHANFVSLAMTATTSIDRAAFQDACARHSHLLVRGKGIVSFIDGACVWQQSGRRTEFHPATTDPTMTATGPASRIVLIATDPLDDAVSSFAALGFQVLAPEPVPISSAR